MKYSEFRKVMEDKGFKVEEFIDYISVYTITGLPVAKIGKDFEGVVDLDFSGYVDLDLEERQMIAQKVMELSFTELEDREDVEEKFKLKQKGVSGKYLIWIPEIDRYTTGSSPFPNVEGVFTQSEIDNMPECYTHPAVWEKIKVERDK